MADDFTTAVANLPFIKQRNQPFYPFYRITPQGLTREQFQKRADINSSLRDLRHEDHRLTQQLDMYTDLQEKNPQHYDILQNAVDEIHKALGEIGQHIANIRSMRSGIPVRDTLDELGLPTGRGLRIRNRVLRRGSSIVRRSY
jgi:hypothetical protein